MTMGNAGKMEPNDAATPDVAPADGVLPAAEGGAAGSMSAGSLSTISAPVEALPVEALPVEAPPAEAAPADEEVVEALERVLAAPDLRTSPRLGAFLRYVVEARLAGRAEQIKGYTIAVEALGRPASFDPQSDPIVRVEATRLRRALQNYYNTDGLDDPLQILIPKGGYVPQFVPRKGAVPAVTSPAAAVPAPLPEAAPVPIPVPAPAARAPRRWAAAAMTAVVAATAACATAAVLWLSGMEAPPVLQSWLGGRPPLADRVRLPIVEVTSLASNDSREVVRNDLRSIEERLRDAFAQFDFAEVRAGTGEGLAARECNGRQPRSVFVLGGLAEPRADGTFSLMLHLADRCEGVIVWSQAIDGLKAEPGSQETELQVVREVTPALMESYGVVPVRARSQVLAHAPGSGFGCVAAAFAVLRNDGSASATTPRACLTSLVTRDGEFALGHAVRASLLLDEAMRGVAPAADTEHNALMLREAELAADLAPTSAYAARTLALVQLYLGQTENAVASGERALRLNPLDFDVAAAVGSVLIGAGRVEEGEALLRAAQAHGAGRAPLQEAYLAIAAFLKRDPFAAQAMVPQLRLHSGPQSRLALALALHALERSGDEREAVRALARLDNGGAEGVRRLVRHLLPAPAVSERALDALEAAGLSQEAATLKRPRG
ncbi:hypothetical protein [Xanthobacter sp. ZOL 2024]